MIYLAAYLGILLASVCFPSRPVPLIALVLACVIAVLARKQWRSSTCLLAACLTSLPLGLILYNHNKVRALPINPDLQQLNEMTHWRRYLDDQSQEAIFKVLDSFKPHMDNPDASTLLPALSETFVSLTVLNLNMSPVVWSGQWFSDKYRHLKPGQPELVLRDGRVFYVSLVPLPSPEHPRGFLCLELLILSNHSAEQGKTWLSQTWPVYNGFKPVVIEPHNTDFMEHLAQTLDMPEPPFEIHFVPEIDQSPFLDVLALIWALLFLALQFQLQRGWPPKKALAAWLVFLAILAFPRVENLDFMTSFASYIFGNAHFGSLLSTPFHLMLTVGLGMLCAQTLCSLLLRTQVWLSHVLFLLILLGAIAAPAYLQHYNGFSFVHPLDGLLSPGALLCFLAFLTCFAYLVLLFNTMPNIHWQHKLPTILISCGLVLGWYPAQFLAAVSISLIWVLKDYQAPISLKAALVVVVFYPFLVLREQDQEVQHLRNNVLDEITLLVERNYFRMGRIIQQIPYLLDHLEHENPDLMEMFARRCGLFADEIDFALQLTRQGGLPISVISQHVVLAENQVRASENRITTAGPEWLTFRRTLDTDFGQYDFLAVLGNDFRNLSLIRELRYLDSDHIGPSRSYLAYAVDVFDPLGKPLYTQRKAEPLSQEERERLGKESWFWRVSGKNTVFFFRDREYCYRITHKATPFKMIFVRFLSLFLATVLIIKVIRLAQRPGRGLLARWNRSFAIKLAGLVFLGSVLPTSMLGFILLNSIRGNQVRATEDMARTKILAAKNLLNAINENEQGTVPGGIQSQRPSNRSLRVGHYARLLGEDLSLYINGTMVTTSQPEAFRRGLMSRRLDYPLARRLYLDRAPYRQERGEGGLEITYTPFELGPNSRAVLAMTMIPFSRTQQIRWLEQIEFSVSILLGLMFLMGLLARVVARYFLEPVSAITRRASRVARGMRYRPIPLDRQDELQQMVDAFNTMQERIQESQDKLKQQLQLLDETLKSMSGGLLGFDSNGRTILKNERVGPLLGMTQTPGRLQELVDAHPEAAQLMRAFEHGQDAEVDWTETEQTHSREIMARMLMVPSARAGNLHAIVAIEDITDALAANRFKAWSEMARRVAHEIKNPLTPIQLELDHMLRLYQDEHPDFGEALEEACVEIRTQVKHLKRIATEFADYARPVELNPAEMDLAKLVMDILEPYRKTLDAIDIETFLEPNSTIQADGHLLRRAVHNLIINAIQAMEEEGFLRVRLFRESEWMNLWIEDTGPGIDEEEARKVFEAYFSTKDHGSGLGLGIAKRYVDLHGGQLSIDLKYTEGTRFVIKLPISSRLE